MITVLLIRFYKLSIEDILQKKGEEDIASNLAIPEEFWSLGIPESQVHSLCMKDNKFLR